jgi:hypothetical protein
MQKPENKFRIWFLTKFRGWLGQVHPGVTFVARKHADYATSGILDMSLTINGMTVWTEFKQVPTCVKGRKLDVSELQRVELDTYTEAGAPACVLVGLHLGKGLGYDVAIFKSPVPKEVFRSDFRRMGDVFKVLYEMAYIASLNSNNKFVRTR